MTAHFVWTQEMDDILAACARENLSTAQAAIKIGTTRNAVKHRAVRIGVKFSRFTARQRIDADSCHAAADERSAEILRKVGMKV